MASDQLALPPENTAPPRKIVAFRQDEAGDWVALLACGHRQHVRHDPPLVNRPWVLSAEGRQRFIGFELNCKLCAEGVPPSETPGASA